jgi:hypothetical protein
MVAASSHFNREQPILLDLEASFPDFTGMSLSWVHNPHDPPDFIARRPEGARGLEIREWLDFGQTRAAAGREDQRDHLMKIIGTGWESEYQPANIACASIEPHWGQKVKRADEAGLHQEFYRCATQADRTWFTNPERRGRGYYQTEFPGYPLTTTYLQAIRFIDGPTHDHIWMQVEGDGGTYDPGASIQTLENALADKLAQFAKPERQAKVATHNMVEHYLLIHGGWNTYTKNTPHHPLTLREISRQGAACYATHPERGLFDRVWFYHSLDSRDDINQLFGFGSGAGRVRWLAQLWPLLRVYEGSFANSEQKANMLRCPSGRGSQAGRGHHRWNPDVPQSG